MNDHPRAATSAPRLNVLFIGGFDSTNYVYVELIRELEARGHSCTVLVDNEHDIVNNKMFANSGIVMAPLSGYPIAELRSVHMVVCGQFIRRSQRRLFDAIAQQGTFLVSFANLFSSVTMRVPADLVITTSESKFAEFAANGLDYNMVAIGNPQYDPLIRAREGWRAAKSAEIQKVLIVEQGAYPFGETGKKQLAASLMGIASSNPDMTFHIKPRYLPDEHGEQLHSLSNHLYQYLGEAPSNLVLIRETSVLEELVLGYDAMITTWSTAHLDAGVLGMPLLLIGGLDSIDVFDVRRQRVASAYAHLRDTGCLADWREVEAGDCSFSPVSNEYLRQEFHDPGTPCSPKVIDLFESIERKVLRPGLRLAGSFQLGHQELMDVLESGIETRVAGSREDQLDRQLFRRVNTVVQALVFDNRCMGHVLDMSELLPCWSERLPADAGEREIDRLVKQTRDLGSAMKGRYFDSHPEEVASDKFIQDHYFDYLLASRRTAELLSYAGPLVVPESLEYNRGLVYLKKGRVISAGRNLTGSFSISLLKPVRELRKDKNITVILSRTDRSPLAHAILLALSLYGMNEALSVVDVPPRPDFDALVYYRLKALVALGRKDEAIQLKRWYAEKSQRSAPTPRRGLKGKLLLLVIRWYRLRLNGYLKSDA